MNGEFRQDDSMISWAVLQLNNYHGDDWMKSFRQIDESGDRASLEALHAKLGFYLQDSEEGK